MERLLVESGDSGLANKCFDRVSRHASLERRVDTDA